MAECKTCGKLITRDLARHYCSPFCRPSYRKKVKNPGVGRGGKRSKLKGDPNDGPLWPRKPVQPRFHTLAAASEADEERRRKGKG